MHKVRHGFTNSAATGNGGNDGNKTQVCSRAPATTGSGLAGRMGNVQA